LVAEVVAAKALESPLQTEEFEAGTLGGARIWDHGVAALQPAHPPIDILCGYRHGS
jgi:hypothetical protein